MYCSIVLAWVNDDIANHVYRYTARKPPRVTLPMQETELGMEMETDADPDSPPTLDPHPIAAHYRISCPGSKES